MATAGCPLSCRFCPKRKQRYVVKGHPLALKQPPTVAEIKAACGNVRRYHEVVFVGLGEPTQRLEELLEVARWLKDQGARVRVDSDGLASLAAANRKRRLQPLLVR